MILFINTSRTDLIEVKLIKDGKVIGRQENYEEYKQSELLLSMIDKLFQNLRSKIKNLEMVAVVVGPGAFSALRLGVTTANALAWSLEVSVIEVSAEDAVSEEKLIKILTRKTEYLRSKANNQFKFAVPKYGNEPNITRAKN